MTLLRVLKFCSGWGVPSETNVALRVIEPLIAVAFTVLLAAAWTHDPEPATEDVSYLCRRSALNCRAMAHEARTQAIEALEGS